MDTREQQSCKAQAVLLHAIGLHGECVIRYTLDRPLRWDESDDRQFHEWLHIHGPARSVLVHKIQGRILPLSVAKYLLNAGFAREVIG